MLLQASDLAWWMIIDVGVRHARCSGAAESPVDFTRCHRVFRSSIRPRVILGHLVRAATTAASSRSKPSTSRESGPCEKRRAMPQRRNRRRASAPACRRPRPVPRMSACRRARWFRSQPVFLLLHGALLLQEYGYTGAGTQEGPLPVRTPAINGRSRTTRVFGCVTSS